MATIGRNTPCPCGSGKKYKHCCLNKRETVTAVPPTSTAKMAYIFSTPRGPEAPVAAPPPAVLAMLDELMQQGYTAFTTDDAARACTIWLQVWDQLKPYITPDIRSVETAERLFEGGRQYLFNWCQDLEEALGNAGLQYMSFNQACVNYSHEFCVLLPESNPLLIHNMKRAEIVALFRLGRIEEGEHASQALIAAFPREAFSYINWGDLYHWPHRKAWPADYEKAERLYRMALDADIDEQGREIVLDRLEDLARTRRENDE